MKQRMLMLSPCSQVKTALLAMGVITLAAIVAAIWGWHHVNQAHASKMQLQAQLQDREADLFNASAEMAQLCLHWADHQ